MKIRYLLVLLSLGIALNASATNSHDGYQDNVWSIPSHYNNAHDIVWGDFTIDANQFFGHTEDDLLSWFQSKNGGTDLSWLFGSLTDVFQHFNAGHHDWDWDDNPYCPPGTVSAVPEPETYAMLLAGLGLMGFVVRRKKKLERQ
jgi:hypothetical protein